MKSTGSLAVGPMIMCREIVPRRNKLRSVSSQFRVVGGRKGVGVGVCVLGDQNKGVVTKAHTHGESSQNLQCVCVASVYSPVPLVGTGVLV